VLWGKLGGLHPYPGDSLRRAEIVWQDTVNRRRPARLILRGDRSYSSALTPMQQLNPRVSQIFVDF
jgi:hypothetical protein